MNYRLIKQIDFYCPKTSVYSTTTDYELGEYAELHEAQEARRKQMINWQKWDSRDDRAVKYMITDSNYCPITTA